MTFRLVISSSIRAAEVERANYLANVGAADSVIDRWFADVDAALTGLRENPGGRPRCLDDAAEGTDLREAYVGRSKSHRLIFEVRGTEVRVLPLWPTALGDFTADDL